MAIAVPLVLGVTHINLWYSGFQPNRSLCGSAGQRVWTLVGIATISWDVVIFVSAFKAGDRPPCQKDNFKKDLMRWPLRVRSVDFEFHVYHLGCVVHVCLGGKDTGYKAFRQSKEI